MSTTTRTIEVTVTYAENEGSGPPHRLVSVAIAGGEPLALDLGRTIWHRRLAAELIAAALAAPPETP